MILCQVVRIARVPNEVHTVRVHTECLDDKDPTCHPRDIKLHIKVRKILSDRIKMRKRLKKYKVLKTPKRHFYFLILLLLTPFLYGGGKGGGWIACSPPTPYLLNNS